MLRVFSWKKSKFRVKIVRIVTHISSTYIRRTSIHFISETPETDCVLRLGCFAFRAFLVTQTGQLLVVQLYYKSSIKARINSLDSCCLVDVAFPL